jgi:hypothetical protein
MSIKCRILKSGYCELTQWYGVNGHLGIDIVGKNYTLDTVKAHSEGTVVMTQTGHGNNQGSTGNASYGNMVKIEHSSGCYTLYAHLDSVYVKNGQKVAKGQEIGYMGNTGNSYGGHLHFEVWKDNNRIDPYSYLDKDLFDSVTPTVSRDENKDQLKVNVDDLRVRKAPATNQAIIGLAKLNGIYNYYEVKEQGGLMWYKIAEGQWVAHSDYWCTIYPKKEAEDEKVIAELQKQVEQLEKEKQELIDKNKLLEQENKNLKEQDSELNIFVAPYDGLYGINLKQNEIIKYEN